MDVRMVEFESKHKLAEILSPRKDETSSVNWSCCKRLCMLFCPARSLVCLPVLTADRVVAKERLSSPPILQERCPTFPCLAEELE